MKALKRFFRLIHIYIVLSHYGLDKMLLSLGFFPSLRFLIYLNPRHWFPYKKYPRGEAIRRALEELGPIFVKFGQALSTRRDLFPHDIADELTKLQDNVPPFPDQVAQQILEKTFQRPINELFAHFDKTPLASASIAQVHTATLFDDRAVAVKILRPDIHRIIHRDTDLMKAFARLLETYWKASRRLHPVDIVNEFEKTLLDELDLQREAASASQLRRNFKNSNILYVPEVIWPYVRHNVMVMERIHGIPISNITALKEQGVNFKKLAERGVEIFFTQVFRDSFFHADMHSGNLFVSTTDPENPKYIAVDFGIIGTLNEKDKRYLAENFYAFFNRDYQRVAELHIDSGWIPYATRSDEFEMAIRSVCEPIFEKPLKDISCAQMLLRLFQTGRRFNMEIQPQLVLLQKTLFAIEGLGHQLYPELNLWDTAKPFLEKWLKKEAGLEAFVQEMRKQAPYWTEILPSMPLLVHDALSYVKEKRLRDTRPIEHAAQASHPAGWRRFAYGMGSAFLACGIVNYMLNLTMLSTGFFALGASLIVLTWLTT